MVRRRWAVIGLCGGLAIAPGFALAQAVQVRTVNSLRDFRGSELGYRAIPLEQKLRLAHLPTTGILKPAAEDAETAIRTSIQQLSSVLTVQIPAPVWETTLAYAGEDIGIAQAEFGNNSKQFKQYILWNEPGRTSLLLEVRAGRLGSAEPIAELMKELFRSNSPAGMKAVWVELLRKPSDGCPMLDGWGIDAVIRQFALGPQVLISALSDRGQTWLSLTVRYSAAVARLAEVAERFPPLQGRISSWTTEMLLNAATHDPRGDVIGKGATRERIILGDLINRSDFTAEEFRDVLNRHVGDGYFARVPEAIHVAEQTGNDLRFAEVIADYWQAHPRLAQRRHR